MASSAPVEPRPAPTTAAPALVYRLLPNQLTLARLVLASVFFIIVSVYRYPAGPEWALVLSIILFILAAVTDWLDGFLARRWHVESTFGRIMDPFCDKVLVLGAFIFLAGPRFVDPTTLEEPHFRWTMLPGNMISGIYPWMVALVLARELLVTGIRGELEGEGVKFGANLWGKLKMVLQSICIPVVLIIVWIDPHASGWHWLNRARDVLVYATVIATFISGLPYVMSALHVLREKRAGP